MLAELCTYKSVCVATRQLSVWSGFKEDNLSLHTLPDFIPHESSAKHPPRHVAFHMWSSLSRANWKHRLPHWRTAGGYCFLLLFFFLPALKQTWACWASFSQLQRVSFRDENEDGFICPYLGLSKLHDNFPVGYAVYLLRAKVKKWMCATEQLIALMNLSLLNWGCLMKPYISKVCVHWGVWIGTNDTSA